MYFVTLCTAGRLCLFGEVVDGEMTLSFAGQVIESWWDSLPLQFPNMYLDACVVMPNHLHGIVVIESEAPASGLSDALKWFKGKSTNDYIRGVSWDNWPRFHGKLWQPGFYDHIIGSNAALERVRAYIEANPSQWAWDEENPDRFAEPPRAQGPGLPE